MNKIMPDYLCIINNESLILKLYVQPGSRGLAIMAGCYNGALKIKVNAEPVDGKANQAVIAFIQNWLNLKKHQITLISGEKSRLKKVKITGITQIIMNKLLNP